jgi:serine/threonine protein kinase
MVGRTVSHYRIVRELGSGGMGVVFAAEDVRLGRQVAIKFVPEAMADDKQLFERLRSEARTASALNHPHICILHDIGDDEGRPFIVMELLQGRTLRERLASGPLKVHETLEIGVQVADALDAAHRLHIVHRDIKPANLFLTDRGSVKILDFGLAKIVTHQASALTTAPTDLTGAGMTLGTVSYMSPEQVTGEPLDGRSDLFSFGVVLYECVTGHQPFKGKTSGVILSEILNRVPPPPLVLNPDLPMRMQEIITNCLEKDRELRYQDAAALRTDLKRLKRDLESGPRSASRTDIPIETLLSTAEPVKTLPPRKSYGPLVGAIAATAVVSTVAAFYVFRSSLPQSDPDASITAAQNALKPLDGRAAAPETHDAQAPVAREPLSQPPPLVTLRPSPEAPAPFGKAQGAPSDSRGVPERRQESSRALPLPPPVPPPLVAESLPSPVPAPVPPPASAVPQPEAQRPAPAAAPAVAVQQPASAPAAEDDDATIRRVLASYARAIEAKDLDAFRAVKPNLSGAEQRRLEDGFKAVASQKVDITVLSIEHRASSAIVKVRRRDTLTAGGRAQTSDSQQTMTLIRSGAGWVISEIGR